VRAVYLHRRFAGWKIAALAKTIFAMPALG